MKTKISFMFIVLALTLAGISHAAAQSTAFTYQGRLNNNGAVANGSYDFQFILFNVDQYGFPVGPVLTNAAVTVSNGLFATTLDFGTGVYTGTNLWLDISVRPGGNGTFSELLPRQPLTPTPYAVFANSASNLLGTVSAVQLGANPVFNGTVTATNFSGPNGTFIGGNNNIVGINSSAVAIGGGTDNQILANSEGSVIAGGDYNQISGDTSYPFDDNVIAGGRGNFVGTNTFTVVIGGGTDNQIQAYSQASVIGSGENNVVLPYAYCATIPGGYDNVAGSMYSFAAGIYAQATNSSSFVWGDGSATTTSIANNSVTFRAIGGYRFFTGSGAGGAALLPNATAWTTISDRNVKKDFAPVDYQSVLAKLANVPIEQWHYKWEKDSDTLNIGPMAQDFKHAFYPGRDDKGISTLEFDGVELAAIQGLNQKVEEKDMKISELEKRLADLEQVVQTLAAKK